VDYLALGSIIAVTKKHVDRLYVILDHNDEKISELSILMGAKAIKWQWAYIE